MSKYKIIFVYITFAIIYSFFPVVTSAQVPIVGWPTVAGNLQRTNWTPDELSPNSHIIWYRPIDAYVPNNFQVIAANDMVYMSSSRGLYALRYDTGQEVWRYDTEIPLGNSPTIATINGTSMTFVGGYDKKIHAFNALNGQHLWEFSGAKAGFQANPLIVNNTVIAANRDGYVYFLNASNGSLLRQYPPASEKSLGVIHQSPAYKNGVIYLVSDSFYAYAIYENGTLKWKSPQKLPNSGFDSFWPVVFTDTSVTPNQDYIIFTGSIGFREFIRPGTLTMGQDTYNINPSGGWKTFTTLRASDGIQDARTLPAEPIYNPGNQHPPTVIGVSGSNNNLIFETDASGSRAYVRGWRFGSSGFTNAISTSIDSAPDEPQIVSGGGNNIFRNLCCFRIGDYQNISSGSHTSLWNYTIGDPDVAPGFDEKIYYLDPEALANITATYGNINGIYSYHGDQNPFVSYKDTNNVGWAYVHRGNAILAFGPGTRIGKKSLLPSATTPRQVVSLTDNDIKTRLENEVEKIITAGGLLKPGYYDDSQFTTNYTHLDNYFENPGDTLYTLSLTYQYLSSTLQSQVKNFMKNNFFPKYYDPTIHFQIGWKDGVQRGSGTLPTEITNDFSTLGVDYKDGYEERTSWMFPDHLVMNPNNFYAMWKYAEKIAPEDVQTIYTLAKNKLTGGSCEWNDCVQVRSNATNSYLLTNIYELNAYIAGLQGFQKLQDLAGQAGADVALRTRVNTELNRLITLRISNFSKDTPFTNFANGYAKNMLNISRNFMWETPELADIMRQNKLTQVRAALSEYNTVGPYWFVSRFNAATAESAMQNLYDYQSLFQAKAYILKDSREELSKWIDAPAFQLGDLFYIQNLVALIQAASTGPDPSITPSPSPGFTIAQLKSLITDWLGINDQLYFPIDNKINSLDASWVMKWLTP